MKMRSVYLVRHAIAFDRGQDWADDTRRPLTHKGAARMREVVSGLLALGVELDTVITSPLVRAKQTADLIIGGWPEPPALVLSSALSPGAPPSGVSDVLSRHTQDAGIALVGHEPGLGEIAAWLIGARHPLPFKKGGVTRIDVPALPLGGSGVLVWMATPKMLRQLSRV
jgi:phosphohistidine phosphatase